VRTAAPVPSGFDLATLPVTFTCTETIVRPSAVIAIVE